MNKYQKITISIAIISVILTTIWLPWQYTVQFKGISQVVKPAGHHLIFTPPDPETDSEFFGVKLDFQLYLIQLFGIIIVSSGAYLLLKSKS